MNIARCTAEKDVVVSSSIVFTDSQPMTPTMNVEEFFRTGFGFPRVVSASVMICLWSSGLHLGVLDHRYIFRNIKIYEKKIMVGLFSFLAFKISCYLYMRTEILIEINMNIVNQRILPVLGLFFNCLQKRGDSKLNLYPCFFLIFSVTTKQYTYFSTYELSTLHCSIFLFL